MTQKWKPRKYQKRELAKIKRTFEEHERGMLLLWDAGLGKTSTMLAAVSDLLDAGQIGEGPRGASLSCLVTAPLRVAQLVWSQEAEKWSQFHDLSVQLVWARNLAAKRKRADTEADIYVVNHESLEWLLDHWQGWVPDVVVVDEAAKFKNGQSKRFRALKRVLPYTKAVYGLTATPAPNSLQDLWAQAYLVDRGKALGPHVTAFRTKWMHGVPMQAGGNRWTHWTMRSGAEEEIREALSEIASRLELSGNIDLPPLTVVDVPVTLPDDALETYRDFERHLVTELAEGHIEAVHAASATMKLRQIANGAVYLSESDDSSHERIHGAKREALRDLLEEVSGPALVVYEFEHDVPAIEKAVTAARPDATVKRVGSRGATTERQVREVAEWWNGGAGGDGVLVLHPLSGGEGLNLQEGGSHVVQYGLSWRLDGHIQTIGRVWRQGQKRPVIVHRLVAQSTVDEDVIVALKRKDATQADLLAALRERTA